MATVRSAIMKSDTRRRVASNAGHIIIFEPGVEVSVPGIIVNECRRAGAQIVKWVGGFEEIPESTDKRKTPELVTSEVTLLSEDEEDPDYIDDEVLERVSAETDADSEHQALEAERRIDKFTKKEGRISKAILALYSEGDESKFVASTGLPKVSAISSMMGGEQITAQVRDLVLRKMDSQGMLPEPD